MVLGWCCLCSEALLCGVVIPFGIALGAAISRSSFWPSLWSCLHLSPLGSDAEGVSSVLGPFPGNWADAGASSHLSLLLVGSR